MERLRTNFPVVDPSDLRQRNNGFRRLPCLGHAPRIAFGAAGVGGEEGLGIRFTVFGGEGFHLSGGQGAEGEGAQEVFEPLAQVRALGLDARAEFAFARLLLRLLSRHAAHTFMIER